MMKKFSVTFLAMVLVAVFAVSLSQPLPVEHKRYDGKGEHEYLEKNFSKAFKVLFVREECGTALSMTANVRRNTTVPEGTWAMINRRNPYGYWYYAVLEAGEKLSANEPVILCFSREQAELEKIESLAYASVCRY